MAAEQGANFNAGSPMTPGELQAAGPNMTQDPTDKHHAAVHGAKADAAAAALKVQREKTHGYGKSK